MLFSLFEMTDDEILAFSGHMNRLNNMRQESEASSFNHDNLKAPTSNEDKSSKRNPALKFAIKSAILGTALYGLHKSRQNKENNIKK